MKLQAIIVTCPECGKDVTVDAALLGPVTHCKTEFRTVTSKTALSHRNGTATASVLDASAQLSATTTPTVKK